MNFSQCWIMLLYGILVVNIYIYMYVQYCSKVSHQSRLVSHETRVTSRIERRDSCLSIRESCLARIIETEILKYYQTKVSHEKKNTCLMMCLSVPFLKWSVPTVDDSVVMYVHILCDLK